MLTVTLLGPFSLLLVWRTPRLTYASKCLASVIILGLTLYLAYEVWQTLQDFQRLFLSGF